MIGLIGALDGDTDVFGLLGGEPGEANAEVIEVESGDFFVEMLWQHVDLVLVFVVVLVQLELGEDLVGE